MRSAVRIFRQAAVVAAVEPQISAMPNGFSLVQKYYSDGYPTPCNYSYEQRFDFYDDGRFRVVAASLGAAAAMTELIVR